MNYFELTLLQNCELNKSLCCIHQLCRIELSACQICMMACICSY
uniref:Uncharacterized protein n=1 Tax=Arundo donax TaxID=35708 RepID=A0A0A8ZIY9_ARUDO